MKTQLRFGVTILMLGATLAVAKFNARGQTPLSRPLTSIDREIDGWIGEDDPPPAPRILESLSATSFLSRTYRRGNAAMNVWIAFYANQRAGETMHSPKHCVPGTGWEFIEQQMVSAPTDRGPVAVNDYVLIRPDERMRLRMLYWYQSPRRVVASEYTGKIALIWDALRYGETSGSIVRITLADGAAERAQGIAFAAQLIRRMDRCFSR